MKLREFLVAFLLALVGGVTMIYAQNTSTYGTITTASATCTPTSCVYYQIPSGMPWVTLTISGTWTGTLNVETITGQDASYQSINSQTWTLASTITANGSQSLAVGSARILLVNAGVLASGSVQVVLASSASGTPLINPVFPGMVIGNGLQAPNGGNDSSCWFTDGTQGTCGGSPSTEVSPVTSITAAQFGIGCANAADPTGTLDSTCAINAAIQYAGANGAQANVRYALYAPGGTYLINSSPGLIFNPYTYLKGDGNNATTFLLGPGSFNLITVPNISDGFNNLGQSYWGRLSNITLAGDDSLSTGTLLELDSPVNFITDNVRLTNHGGRGIVYNGGAERAINTDFEIDRVREPVVHTHNTNEVSTIGYRIVDPGQTNSAYCYGVNCVNGVSPNLFLSATQVLASASGNGSTASFVLTGNSGTCPIVAGHHFVVSGTTGTVLDGTYTATGCTSNTGSNQYTVTGGSAVSGTATVTGASWKIGLMPAIHAAIWSEGVSDHFLGGSIKSATNLQAIQSLGPEVNSLDWPYVETYGGNAPSATASIGGIMPNTTFTAALTTTGATATPVADTSWMEPFVTNPANSPFLDAWSFWICPADCLAGSTATSTAFPSVTKGTHELVNGYFAGDGQVHITARAQGGTTAQLWPSGSIIEYVPPSSYGNGLAINFAHLQAAAPPNSNSAIYACLCVDGTTTTSAEFIAGVFEDDIQFSSTGLTAAPPAQALFIMADSFRGVANGVNTPESRGAGTIKAVGPVSVHLVGSLPSNMAVTPEIMQGGLLSGLPGIIPVTYSTGMQPDLSYSDDGGRSFLNFGTGGATTMYLGRILGNVPNPDNFGANPGQSFAQNALQYSNSLSIGDVGNLVVSTTGTALAGSNTVTLAAANSNIAVGQGVYSPTFAIPSFTTVTAVSGTTITLNQAVNPPGLLSSTINFSNNHAQYKCSFVGGPQFTTGTFSCGQWNGTSYATDFSLGQTNAQFNESITTTGTIAAPGIGIGSMQNVIPNSANFSASSWSFPYGTQTPTTGQADPWGTNTATSWTLAASTYFQLRDTTTFPIVSGTSYTVCYYAMASITGAVFNFNVGNGGGQMNVPVPTSYPSTPTCIGAQGAGTSTTQGINFGMQNAAGSTTFTIAAIWVVPPGIGTTYHPTAAVPDMNPTPAVVVGAYPTAFVYAGSATLGGTSIPASSCSPLGTITVPGAAAGMAVSLAPASSVGSAFALGIPIITANTVSASLCNVTAAAATPTSVVWQARVSP